MENDEVTQVVLVKKVANAESVTALMVDTGDYVVTAGQYPMPEGKPFIAVDEILVEGEPKAMVRLITYLDGHGIEYR